MSGAVDTEGHRWIATPNGLVREDRLGKTHVWTCLLCEHENVAGEVYCLVCGLNQADGYEMSILAYHTPDPIEIIDDAFTKLYAEEGGEG